MPFSLLFPPSLFAYFLCLLWRLLQYWLSHRFTLTLSFLWCCPQDKSPFFQGTTENGVVDIALPIPSSSVQTAASAWRRRHLQPFTTAKVEKVFSVSLFDDSLRIYSMRLTAGDSSQLTVTIHSAASANRAAAFVAQQGNPTDRCWWTPIKTKLQRDRWRQQQESQYRIQLNLAHRFVRRLLRFDIALFFRFCHHPPWTFEWGAFAFLIFSSFLSRLFRFVSSCSNRWWRR